MRREILWLLLLCGMLLCNHLVIAQTRNEVNTSASIEAIVEKVVSNSILEDDANDESCGELTLYLFSIAHSGLFVNIKGIEELEHYGVLTSFEKASLKEYLKQYGEILSFAELLLVPGLEKEKIELLLPFLRFSNSYYLSEGPNRFYSSLLIRSSVILERQRGYTPILQTDYVKKPESRYLGNPFLLYGQYRIDAPKNISAIITTKKDPGERGVDYLSWSASISQRGVLENLIIGSYIARKGQGLILWNGFSLNSAWDPASAMKRDYGITPYSSAQEDRAFKGVAATISKGNFSLDLLTSFRNYDARTIEDGYTSLLTTGLHNTPLTIQRKNSLHSTMAATCINFNNETLNCGVIISAVYNSLPYAGKDSSLILMENKIGNYRANSGVNWRYFYKKAIIFGELAFDMRGNASAFTGIAIRLKSGSELLFTGKYNNTQFVSPLSFLSKIPRGNQFLCGISGKFIVTKNINLFALANLSHNYYKINVKCDISTQRKSKAEIRLGLYNDRINFRSDYRKELSKNIIFHTRVDINGCNQENCIYLGYLLQQELIANLFENKMSASCRLSWFCAPKWGSRIYSYERDVLNQFRTTLLYGEGFRWYINLKATLSSKIDTWLKYSCTYYTDRDKIGEGPEEISGPSKSEVKLELRLKF